ncbi:Uncharacterized protein TCM_014121 [Theobroma cacao]|uniref:Uncharacterized protein n=1 Tax=Theobroma cacao TaxID=3641 RepID=A0A061FXZ8_THECC|nr:Uncharacterized protein TCM_014121 [Theobroma cacao]
MPSYLRPPFGHFSTIWNPANAPNLIKKKTVESVTSLQHVWEVLSFDHLNEEKCCSLYLPNEASSRVSNTFGFRLSQNS